MKTQLEMSFNKPSQQIAGHFVVTRTGTCSGYHWKCKFLTVGGNKQTLEIVNSTLKGLDVVYSVETIQDGGMLFGPLTGEFLQTAEEKPQVGFDSQILKLDFHFSVWQWEQPE